MALSIGISITAVLVCGLAALLLWPGPINDLFSRKDQGRLALDARAADGTVSGTYRAAKNLGGGTVLFGVSPEGVATFRVKGAPESETLTAALSDEKTAGMTWAGVTLDGLGALSSQEQAAMNNLLVYSQGDLLNGLTLIPLDIACLAEGTIDGKQLAALLFPAQMRLKYLVADRPGMAGSLIALSGCDYASREENRAEHPTAIQYTPAMPVPVVHGYFPFDEVGAVETPVSLAPWSDVLCANTSPAMAAGGLTAINALDRGLADNPAPKLDEMGPCESMCRGACGPDCTLNNCTVTPGFRCETDKQGRNTGMGGRVLRYECGMHQGCIDHDACYDRCNATWGCGTWEAAYCRHGRAETLPTIATDLLVRGYEYCDEVAWLQYPTAWTALWVRGYGPQPLRQVFEYTDLSQGLLSAQLIRDLEKCPLPAEGGAEAPKPPAGDQQPPAPPAGDRWRLTDVQIREHDCGSYPIRDVSGAFGQQSVSAACDGEEYWGSVHTEGTMHISYPDRMEGGQLATFTVQAEGSMRWELTDPTRSGKAVLQLVMNVDRASNACGHTVSPSQEGGATGSATLRVEELTCSYDPVADLGSRDEVKIMFKFWPSAGHAGAQWYNATGAIDLTYERCSSPDDC